MLRDKPNIDSDYIMKRPWVHPSEREDKNGNFDQNLQDKRNNDPSRFVNELKECTFHPDINGSYNDRSYEDLKKWGEDKRLRLAISRLNKDIDLYSHQPELNYNSVKIAGKREGAVEDRLMQTGENYG